MFAEYVLRFGRSKVIWLHQVAQSFDEKALANPFFTTNDNNNARLLMSLLKHLCSERVKDGEVSLVTSAHRIFHQPEEWRNIATHSSSEFITLE